MDPEKLGVVIPPKEGDPGAGNPPKEGEGSSEGGKVPQPGQPQGQEKQPEGQGGTPKEGDGTGQPQGQPHQPESKRINDLMSKWQTEESAHKKTQSELEAAKQLVEVLKGQITGGKPAISPDGPSFLKPDWKPETFQDLQKALVEAKEWGKKEMLDEFQSKESAKQTAEKQIDSFVEFLGKNDPEFDEDTFFEYVNEHKFSPKSIEELGSVYSSFVSVRESIKEAQNKTKQNIQNRQGEGVHAPGGGGGGQTGVMTGEEIAKGRNVYDVAMETYRRLTGK